MAQRTYANPDVVVEFVHFGGFDAPMDLAGDLVVIDVETTGLDPTAGERVVEVAAVRTRGDGEVLSSFASLIDPGLGTTGAPEIHGITVDMLCGAPTFADIWPALEAMLAGAVFVAHNAAFDAAFLAAEARVAGVDIALQPGLCSMWLARQALPALPSHRLAAVRDELGLHHDKAHAALDDVMVVVEALPHLLPRVPAVRHYVPLTAPAATVPTVVTVNRR